MPPPYFKGHVRRPDKDHLIQLSALRHGHRLRALLAAMTPPAKWDSRTLGLIGPIKDQGQCGSCWDFSGTFVCEVAYSKAGQPGVVLSEEYTLSCGKNGGCDGDDNTTVLDWCKATGLPQTSDYGAYDASAGKCAWKSNMALYKIDDWGFADGSGGNGVTPTDAIKTAIMTYGCVGCGVAAGGDSFWDSGTGIGTGKSSSIDHDVGIVGWDDTQGKGGVWIMRNSWGCYDDATEILTDRGWLSFKDVKDDEIVATLNPDTHALEYHRIEKRHEYDYNGDLWSYQAQGVDLLVTPNHKMYTGGWIKEQGRAWKLMEAQDIRFPHFRMKKDAGWEVPDVATHRIGDKEIPMDLWLEFLGYFVSEGWTCLNVHERKARVRNRGGVVVQEAARIQTNYTVGISQNPGAKASVMMECLDRLPFKFCRSGDRGWTTNNKVLHAELAPLGKAHEKHLPEYAKNVSRRQANILLDAMILGDGTRGVQTTYFTSSGRLADDVQELALKAGFAADVRRSNRVGRSNGSGGTTRFVECQVSIKATRTEPCPDGGWHPEKVPYNGKVYCVTAPNHIVYVRRNGKAVWCGNSGWGNGGYGLVQYGAYDLGTESVWAVIHSSPPPIDWYC